MTAAAFFDLDRTLISGASVFPFAVEAWRQGLASHREIAGWALDALAFVLLGESSERNDEARSAVLDKIAGVAVDQLEKVGDAMVPRLVDRVRPESLKLLSMHHQAGRDTWIASAAPIGIVERLAAALDMTGGIGTNAVVVDGHYTDRLDGPFVHGPGKAKAVASIISSRGYDPNDCYAYSDSISDLPLLELIGHPVAVNPDSALSEVARERGWPVVIFARRTKQAIKWSAGGTLTTAAAISAYLLGRRHGRVAALADTTRLSG